MKTYDIVIIGAGIAGLTAGIYAARSGKKTCIIEKGAVGGRILSAAEVVNYPGVPSCSGWDIIEKAQAQAESFGAEIIYDTVTGADFSGEKKTVRLSSEDIACSAVILAMGAGPKPLGIERERELVGSGVSYCATCDGAFFRGKDVMVAGSGKTAVEDVEYLAPIAKKVYVVGEKRLPTFSHGNIERIENAKITSLAGMPLTEVGVSVSGEEKKIPVSGLFVAIGSAPDTLWLDGAVGLDEKGYIITDERMRTTVGGVFAAGDVRKKDLRQLVTAAADGAIAATEAGKIVKK